VIGFDIHSTMAEFVTVASIDDVVVDSRRTEQDTPVAV
jgi:hypothetical protein